MRRKQGRLGHVWHVYEVFVTIRGKRHYLWRAVDQDGGAHVVKAGATFEPLATNPMCEVVMASPALAGGMIIIRMQSHLAAIGTK